MRSLADPDGGPVASGQTLGGQMDLASDMDGFQFWGAANQYIIVNAFRTSGSLTPYIELWPPSGGPLEAAGSGNSSGGRLIHPLADTGLYTITITDNNHVDTGAYQVTFMRNPGAVSSLSDLDGGLISLVGLPLPGHGIPASPDANIDVASDFDVFQVYGAVGDSISITATTTSGSLAPWIELYPPSGGPVEAAGSGSLIRQLAEAGLYAILITDNDHVDTGAYTVTVANSSQVLRDGIYAPQPPVGGAVYSGGSWGSFTWEPLITTEDTLRYDVFLGTNVTQPLSILSTGLMTNSVHVPALSSGPVYYWHVVAYAGNDTVQGPYWWFVSSDATDVGDPSTPPETAVVAPTNTLRTYPNPFNPRTTVTYFVAQPNLVRLSIHDVRGRLVTTLVDRWHSPGQYSVPWNGVDGGGVGLGSGLYFVRYTTGAESRTHKVVLMR